MQIIDAHQHFWKYHPERQTWIGDDMKLIQKDFLPTDLKIVLEQNKIDSCISVQVDENKEETLFQIECAKQNAFITGIVGWINLLNNKKIEQDLEYYSQFELIKGFRYILQGAPNGLMLEKSFVTNLNNLSKRGYTYDLLIYNNQLPEAIELLKKVPNLPIVLNHIAKPNIKDQKINEWEKQIKKLAEHENVYCKISGLATEADWLNWKNDDLYPYIDIIVENFGIDRIMFGSDWPVCLVATSYERWLNLLKSYFNKFSEDEKNKFFSVNCKAFYKLNF